MEIVLGAIVAAVVSASVVLLLRPRTVVAGGHPPDQGSGRAEPRGATVAEATASPAAAPTRRPAKQAPPAAAAEAAGAALDRDSMRAEVDAELRERRAEIARIEERILRKEEALDVRLTELERRETALADR